MWEVGGLGLRAWPLKKSGKPIWAFCHLGRSWAYGPGCLAMGREAHSSCLLWVERKRRAIVGWFFAAAFFFRPWDSRLGLGLRALLHVYFFFLSPLNYLLNIFPMSAMHEFYKMPLSVVRVMNILHPYIVKVGLLVRLATLRLLMSRSIRRAVSRLLWDIQARKPTWSSHEMSEGWK